MVLDNEFVAQTLVDERRSAALRAIEQFESLVRTGILRRLAL